MRTTNVFAVGICVLLTSSRVSFAQSFDTETDATLALQRAGALVSFEKTGSAKVSLSGLKSIERLLDHVKVLSDVESLELGGTDVNDKSLEKISGLTKLTSVNLGLDQSWRRGAQAPEGPEKPHHAEPLWHPGH